MAPISVYVAGPLTSGNVADNVKHAVEVGDALLSHGYTPFIPHLTHLWELIAGKKTWDAWLEYEEKWLAKCDVLYRLGGDSPGADREVRFAHANNIPVVFSLNELMERFPI